MQAGRKKFTFRTKKGHDFCENCIRKKDMCILLAEVRKHERGRKKAGPLGSGGSQAPCDPLRPPGKPCAQRWTVKDCLCLQRFCRGGTVPACQNCAIILDFPREITWIVFGDVILFQNHREGHCSSHTMDGVVNDLIQPWKQKTGPPQRSCFSFVLLQRISR